MFLRCLQAAKHYEDLSKRPFFPSLVKYFASGPICAMVWEGPNVILTGRKMLGATNPDQSEPGTLRFDLSIKTGTLSHWRKLFRIAPCLSQGLSDPCDHRQLFAKVPADWTCSYEMSAAIARHRPQ